ncbi:MAG: lipoyl synthase [Planctomycetota bacterium]|jgi:lipoic acid synthetase
MSKKDRNAKRAGFPPWIRRQIPAAGSFAKTREILEDLRLETVCSGAKCPNRSKCYARGTATFLILGSHCSRNCGFCSIEPGSLAPLDPGEPSRVAEAVRRMGVKHAVITSVTRDDLGDGGASQFAVTVKSIRERNPTVSIEVLTPDFGGRIDAVRTVADAGPDVYNHNVETVPSLYPEVRPDADFGRSLDVLRAAKEATPGRWTKSGLMLGLGETGAEVVSSLRALRAVDCDFVTIGQYLKPAPGCLEVKEYVTPEVFEGWRRKGLELGFRAVASAPFVRSSFRAEEMLVPQEPNSSGDMP